MLDTNILIYLIKNRPAEVAKHINRLTPDDTLCMSFVTYAELLKGAERSARRDQVLLQLDALTGQVPVHYQLDAGTCQHYARQSTRLRDAGTPIGANDLWIACHALSLGCVLVSNNLREFKRIEALQLENWAVA
jgi:tRNA(fMet)-specific endonuclease VapC